MSGLLFGADRAELKARMERIIVAEEETVKTMKKQIEALTAMKITMELLMKCIGEHKAVMERMCTKL